MTSSGISNELDNGNKSENGNKQEYSCEICERQFGDHKSLVEHMQEVCVYKYIICSYFNL